MVVSLKGPLRTIKKNKKNTTDREMELAYRLLIITLTHLDDRICIRRCPWYFPCFRSVFPLFFSSAEMRRAIVIAPQYI